MLKQSVNRHRRLSINEKKWNPGESTNQAGMGGLPKAGMLSLLLHVALAAIFMLTFGPDGKKKHGRLPRDTPSLLPS